MKIYKRVLLAGLVVAVAGLAVSASASAAVWKEGSTNVSKLVTLGLTGAEVFEPTEGNGMSCETHLTMTTEGGSTGKVTKVEPKTCTGFGTYAKCTVVVAEAKTLPWTVTVNATDLSIANWRVRRTFKTGCTSTELDKTITSMTVPLIEPSAITTMELSGLNGTYKIFGSFTVDSPNSGKYGIG